MEKEKLIARLNRVIGQIEAVKKNIEGDTPDEKECLDTIHLIKAATNALKKFGEVYVQDYFDQCLSESPAIQDEEKNRLQKELKSIIQSAFTL